MTEPNISLEENYNSEFYECQSRWSYRSAELVLPHVLHAIGRPSCVLDVGCGVGAWLRAIRDLVPDTKLIGVDHPDVPPNLLMISREEFVGRDIRKRLDLGQKFDLAMCLEVGEHLDHCAAETLVENLSRHSNIILFSAAIPGQGGHNHVNENWPCYWIELFRSQGFLCHDIIRPKIWNNSEIAFWYRQNTMLFAKAHLAQDACKESFGGANVVHPDLFEKTRDRVVTGREALSALKTAITRRLKNTKVVWRPCRLSTLIHGAKEDRNCRNFPFE